MIADWLADRPQPGLLVVDEACQEFTGGPSAIGLLGAHPNLAVARTMSKAHGLTGARMGFLIANPA